MLQFSALDRAEVTATLETDGSNKTLDLGSLGVRLRILLLRTLHLPTNNVLADIILLRQVEHLADVRCPLGTEALGEDGVSETGDF